MNHRFHMSTLALIAMISLTAAPAAGQTASKSSAPAAKKWTPLKTAGGEPSLEGTWTSTTTAPLERPPQFGNRLYLTDEEYAERVRQQDRQRAVDNEETSPNARISTGPPDHWTERAKGVSRQTSLVVDPEDGRVPVKAAAEATRDYNAAHNTEAFEYMSPWDRCITRGMPGGMLPGGYGNVYEIVQGPGVIAIVSEMIHETRIIPLDGRPFSNLKQWNGESIGHWEGNTLVVETKNYNDKGWIATNLASGRIKGIAQSEALHVTERFTRMDADTIQYELTIEDPNIYTKPWKVVFPLYKDPEARVFEYACHEGNYSMMNMLSGARADEKKAAEEAAKRQN